MKIRTIIVWTIALVAIEQAIKLVISTNYRDINFEIIPSLLEFKPTLNNKSFYWLGLMGIDVGRWARLVTGIIYLGMLCLFYLYTRAILNKEKWTDVGFIFGLAGILCSMCDNIFFGGSWDYIYLKPLFVFDIKDLYLNCFAALILVSFTKNKAKIKNVKIKDIISLAKNSQKQNQDEKNVPQ